MKFKMSSAGLVEKAGWDDVNCDNKPIKSVCQYSIKQAVITKKYNRKTDNN